LLEYEGAELLLVAARVGEGLETRLGDGRGDGKHASLFCYVALKDSKTALRDVEKKDSEGSIDEILRELATDSDGTIPCRATQGALGLIRVRRYVLRVMPVLVYNT
jgi:hypothetical protein